MSKFVKMCESFQAYLREQGTDQMNSSVTPDNEDDQSPIDSTEDINSTEVDNPDSLEASSQLDPNTESELPVVSNDEIAKLAKAIQIFYSSENSKLTQDQINQIKGLNPKDSKEDVDIKKVVDTLTGIFDPTSVKLAPDSLPDSDFE